MTHGLSSLPPLPTAALQSEQEEGVLGSTPAHPPPWKPSSVLSSERLAHLLSAPFQLVNRL